MIKTPLSTAIGGVGFYTKNTLVVGGHKSQPPFDIASLFSGGAQGIWLDPNDLSTMYQDVSGTTSVTAAGQTVALVINKVGQSTISDLTLPSITTWVKSSLVTELTDSSFTVTGGGGIALQVGNLNIGSMHEILIEYVVDTVASLAIYDSAGPNASNLVAISSNGKLTAKYRSQSGGMYLRASGAAKITITKLEVKRISTGDAYQITSASTPIYRDKYIQFDGIDDFLMLPVFQLPQPFTVIMAVETVKTSGTQALFSSGQSGYLLMTTSGSNLGTQQNTGNPVIYQPKNLIDVLAHRAENGLVKIKSNIGEITSDELVANNPYSAATQKYIGNFNNTSFSTAAGIKLYAMLVINRALTDEEEAAVRKEFNKKMGVV